MNKHEIYRAIVIANSLKPSKYVASDFSGVNYHRVGARSQTCSDFYEMFLQFKGPLITQAFFTGYGCSISKSATNLLCEYLVGKTKQQAIDLIITYRQMVMKEEVKPEILGDLIAFENVALHLNRIPCALMSANALLVALEERRE